MDWKMIGLHDEVRFRLTERGERLWRNTMGQDSLTFMPPDAEGWREAQLWLVMAVLGPDLHMGIDNPMDTTIYVRV